MSAPVPQVQRLLQVELFEQGSAHWFAQRHQMLTASDVASVLGLNPHRSANDVLFRKLQPPCRPERTGCAATDWGHRYEDEARRLYEERTGETVYEFGVIPHPEHRWLGGSPDGITGTGRLLEIKCPFRRRIVPGQVPEYYLPQVQLLMEILDLEVCDFVQYVPGDEWREITYEVVEVPRDRTWFAAQLPVLRAFWERVKEARGALADAQQHLENRAATVLQCAHRALRERVCRPDSQKCKEANRNLVRAEELFREERLKRVGPLSEDKEPPKKKTKRKSLVVGEPLDRFRDYAVTD